ncbi:MAG: outer membrane protein assembly factor BamD [Mucilaginibacter polytrichastri]|nr:outer membrane protein assembly factor BamD [Mucilaginibacter polytrichastri]
MFLKKRFAVLVVFAVFTLIFSACKSKFEKLKASNDNARKYKEAINYYKKKDYNRALLLFEDLVQRYKGRPEAEDLFFDYADANYQLKDYTSARYHFKTFADTYPSSTRAEEARYLAAYCFYLDSPKFSLDQDNTYKAIEALQLFINLYPKSERVEQASKLIANLRDKLERKSFENAKLYLTISDYKSAVIAFRNTLRDYPDTKYAEEIEFLSLESQYLYARNSIETRQMERYEEAVTMSTEFAEKYPQSKFLKQAASYKKDSENGIKSAQQFMANADNVQKVNRKLGQDTAVRDTATLLK